MVTKNSNEFDPYIERKAFDETKEGVKGLVDAKITEIPRIFHIHQDTLTDKKPSVTVSDLEIPTIDFASVHVDTSSREAVVEKVKYAAEKWGFFQVINHGVPLHVLEEIKDGVRRFHEEALEVKKRYFSRDSANKKFVYNSNFDLYSSSPSVNWRDSFTCYTASSDPPTPEELPVTCRVLANRQGPRISVASFFSSSKRPNSTVYGPMKELVSEDNPPKYRDITLNEYTEGFIEKGLDGTSHLLKFRI